MDADRDFVLPVGMMVGLSHVVHFSASSSPLHVITSLRASVVTHETVKSRPQGSGEAYPD